MATQSWPALKIPIREFQILDDGFGDDSALLIVEWSPSFPHFEREREPQIVRQRLIGIGENHDAHRLRAAFAGG
jgi:hypothetical protein